MKVKVECLANYNDLQLKRQVNRGEQIVVDRERADELAGLGLVRVVEVVKPEKETATKPKKNSKTTVKTEPKKETATK